MSPTMRCPVCQRVFWMTPGIPTTEIFRCNGKWVVSGWMPHEPSPIEAIPPEPGIRRFADGID